MQPLVHQASLHAKDAASLGGVVPEARAGLRFQLGLALFVTLYYAFTYLRSFDAQSAFAADFMMFYQVGQLLGWPLPAASAIYDLSQAREYFAGASLNYIPYLYLPHFLPVLAPLRGEPYDLAYTLWMGAQLLLYALAARWLALPALAGPLAAFGARTGARWGAVLLIAAAPELAHLIVAGHPSILAALLVYAGWAWLPKKPLGAGALFALACYKPQMAAMLPVLLMAGRHGRALAAFALTLMVLFALGTWAFGFGVWADYLVLVEGHGRIMLALPKAIENQAMGVYIALTLLGAAPWLAGLGQGLAALGVLGLLARAAHRQAAMATLGLLVLAPFFTSPYVMLYDAVMLVPAVALLMLREATEAPRISRRLVIIAGLFLPLAVLVMQPHHIPAGCGMLLWLVWETVRGGDVSSPKIKPSLA